MSRSFFGLQTTLRERVTLSGIGVHCGKPVSIALVPVPANSGINFRRVCDDGREVEISADLRNISSTELCTAVGMGDVSVSTIEHLMATLSALQIDNVTIEIDGPEVPVMDGSAAAFIEAIDRVGVVPLPVPRRYIEVKRAVRVEVGKSFAEFLPHDGTRIEIEIDFPNPLIGRQRYATDLDGECFRSELGRARTFGFMTDVQRLWANGFALGASLDNAVVIDEDRILNPDGLRFVDEFVRHKALDAIGDIALAGAPILGCYRSYRGGHHVNAQALAALLADERAYEMVEMPVRHERVRAGMAPELGVAAGPDVS